MVDTDLAFRPGFQLLALIASKQISPVELTELYFQRIEELDSKLNSYLTLDKEGAMRTARDAESAVIRGDNLGPLHGLPISVKDLEMTRNIRTTKGSLVYQDTVPDEDSVVVERVRNAGAIILGKTNTSEFGFLGAGENRLRDHCRNPWNTERTSGASSAGAGTAEASGLCAMSTGSDGGGSIRIPASFCGIYGIKPTQGRVPRYSGAMAPILPNYLSQSGPMTRTVLDSAILLQVIAGHDPRDPTSMREQVPNFTAAMNIDIRGMKIGWSPTFGYTSVDQEVAELTSTSMNMFEELGCTIDESDLAFDSPFQTWWTIFGAFARISFKELLETNADQLTWYVKELLEDSIDISIEDYQAALGQREIMRRQIDDQFEKFDLIMSPTMPITAFPVDKYPEEIGSATADPNPHWGFTPFTHPINTIGYTAATIPCGFSSDNMPIGLQIIGRSGEEEKVLAASAAFERAKPWIQQHPPVS